MTQAAQIDLGCTSRPCGEHLRYAYDPAGNLNWRTNNALAQQFSVNSLTELTTVSRTGDSTFTVAGTTTSPATNVTVNGLPADIYADSTFAREGFTLVDGTNTFTAIAQDSYGRADTNISVSHLPPSVSFAYDLNGDLRTNGLEILEYDDENQLVTNWVAGAWKSEFVYDGLHRRRIQRDYAWSSGIWNLKSEIHLVYDGNLPLQHRDANNAPRLTLTRGLDLSGTFQGAGGIGGLLALTQPSAINPQHLYYHSDGGGNVTCLLSGSQTVAAQASYDPYGGLLFRTGPAADLNPFWFSSKPLHAQSGYYDFLYRWYAPELQRWLNRDPILEAGGQNLHAFVGNCPLSRLDPLGETYAGNLAFLIKWLFGIQKDETHTEAGDVKLLEMRTSPGANQMREAFYASGTKTIEAFPYGTWRAAKDTLFDPRQWDSTALQVGGFGPSSAVNNGDGTVTFTIHNEASARSFFYHIIPDVNLTVGPLHMRTVLQTFEWTEPIRNDPCQ